jgi:hypothetical protein
MKSMILTDGANPLLIAKNINNGLVESKKQYNIDADYCSVRVFYRKWLSDDEYTKLVKPKERTDIINEVLRDEAELNLDNESKLNSILKFLHLGQIDTYLK